MVGAQGDAPAGTQSSGWQAWVGRRAIAPVRATRTEALDDLVATGHASREDYPPHRIYITVPAEVRLISGR